MSTQVDTIPSLGPGLTALPRVLIVDDSEQQLRLLRRILKDEGYDCMTLEYGRDAIAMCEAFAPNAILLDIDLPDIDGVTVCRTLKASRGSRLIPILMMTGHSDRARYLNALEAGADDFLTKPVRLQELRARLRSAVRMKNYIDQLDDAAASIIMLGRTIEARDRYTEGHCQRLGDYGAQLGTRIGLCADDVRALEQGGWLHDLGKIAVPDAVLFKPGRLTAAEFEVIKTHPVVGDQLCSPLRSLDRVRPIVRSHHETLDGRGYPDGLRGSQVPLLAQITAIVDTYDAITTDRPYRGASTPDVAYEILVDDCNAGRRDHALVDAFISVMSDSTRAQTVRADSCFHEQLDAKIHRTSSAL